MIALGTYLLQMSCWLAAFWLVYVTLLKRETYFNLNRWFLNLGLLVSVVLPLIPIKYNVQLVTQAFTAPTTQSVVVQPIENNLTINYWLIAYLLGALFFISRFIIQHVKLYFLRKRSQSISIDSLKVYQIEKETAPFSFFNQIYVSSKLSSSIELKTIVAHEKVHIYERHWADLLLLEVVRALQWFNPLLQLYRKAIMQNHEYLADSGTIEFGVSAHTYKAIIANQMLGIPVVSFANSFTLFNSTNRILMMNKDKSTPIKRLKILLILPLISIILVGFAKPNYVSETTTNIVAAEGTMKIKGKVTDNTGEALPGASIIVAGTSYGTVADLNGEFTLDAVNTDDNITVSFVGYKTIKLPAKEKMNIKLERNVVLIEVQKEESAPPPPPPPATGLKFRSKDGKTPLIVIDGKISDVQINEIDPNSIEKIEVLKDQSATDSYGEKGKNGVILISTKKITKPVRKSSNDEVFIVVEEMPQYPGGKDALSSYLQSKMKEIKETGFAEIYFIVKTDGRISNVKVVKSDNDKLAAIGKNIINSMPKWSPGKQRGKPVSVEMQIGLEFGSGCYTYKYKF